MILYLIGARGSGKTTLGQFLADRLGFPFVDLDRSLCEHVGKSIAEIVAKDGWDMFRSLESEHLRATPDMAENGNLVVGAGGGIVLNEENRKFLRDSGRVIWLNANAQTLARRLAANPLAEQRPSLTGRSLLEEIGDLVREREGLYRACCHMEVDGNGSPEEICGHILESLNYGKPL